MFKNKHNIKVFYLFQPPLLSSSKKKVLKTLCGGIFFATFFIRLPVQGDFGLAKSKFVYCIEILLLPLKLNKKVKNTKKRKILPRKSPTK